MATRNRSTEPRAQNRRAANRRSTDSSTLLASNTAHRAVAIWRSGLVRLVLTAGHSLESDHGTPFTVRALTNLLRGNDSSTAPEVDRGHQPTTRAQAVDAVRGTLHDHSAAWLEAVVESLIDAGYIEPGLARRGQSWVLTSSGLDIVRGSCDVEEVQLPFVPRLGVEPKLESRLFELRRRLAREEGRPTFSIFDNATLARLVARRPRTLADLATIRGFGASRVKRYGRKVLAALR